MQKQILAILPVVVIVLLCAAAGMLHISKALPVLLPYTPKTRIVLDAGHGGMDGGAVGVNQVVEKHINLSIALKLRDLLEVSGFDVIMTRETDVSLHDPAITGVAQKKRSDMYSRLKLIEENPDAIFISIHQNKFEQSQSNGSQVFYGTKNSDSEILAASVQSSIRELLQKENKRETKPSGKEFFLLYNPEIPAIMVECGFISNPEECAKLVTDSYQDQIAFAIMNGVFDYLGNQSD